MLASFRENFFLKALLLIIAMVNYMKDIISLLELNERVMIDLDRFSPLYVTIRID